MNTCKNCKKVQNLSIALAIAALIACIGILRIGHLLQTERDTLKQLREKK